MQYTFSFCSPVWVCLLDGRIAVLHCSGFIAVVLAAKAVTSSSELSVINMWLIKEMRGEDMQEMLIKIS